MPTSDASALPAQETVAQLFVECLEEEGVEYVFGLPGEETLDINGALDASAQIQFVPVRHEQAAAFMADAFGRLTGRAGVCLATLGPGATNLATGIADATLDHAPMVALTGQIGLQGMHKQTHQYIDVVEMYRPMTKWNACLYDGRITAELVRKAFAVAEAEKPGATHLELPADVMATPSTGRPLRRTTCAVVGPDGELVRQAADVIRSAREPIVLAGNGVARQRAAVALREFCRQTGIPAITTFMGKGAVHASGDRFLFTAGLRALDYTDGAMGRADLVICVGYDVVEWAPSSWNPQGDIQIVCIDTVAADVDASFIPSIELVGDLNHTLRDLAAELERGLFSVSGPEAYQRAHASALRPGTDNGSPVKPQRVLRELRSVLAPSDVLVSDVGVHKLWIARLWEAVEPNTVLMSNGFAAMGFGIPAAIAAALVAGGAHRVAAILGDAGFMMAVAELETAKRLDLPIVFIVWNDGALGLIEMHQLRRFGRVCGTRFDTPDLVGLARSFGIGGVRVESGSQLPEALRLAFGAGKPFVVDVCIDYSENDKLAVDLRQLTGEPCH